MADYNSGFSSEETPFLSGVGGLYSGGAPEYGTAEDSGEGDSDLKKGFSFLEYQKKERGRATAHRKLLVSTVFCFFFMCAEIAGGYFANSLAILTDAAHLMSDLSAFSISILAIHLARRAKTKRMSFGSGRAEVIGAVTSILIIWLLTIWLNVEAIDRIIIIVTHKPLVVDGRLMTIVASLGILVNVMMFGILGHTHGPGDHSHDDDDGGHSHGKDDGGHSHADKPEKADGGHSHADGGHSHSHGEGGHSHDGAASPEPRKKNWEEWLFDKVTGGHSHGDGNELNVRAAMVHVIGDFVQSVGVLGAAIIIWIWPEAKIADPLCTFLFSFLVMATTIPVMKDSLYILLETVPNNCTEDKIVSVFRKTPGVLDVVDIHCWSISQGVTMLVAHVKPRDTITTAQQCFQVRRTYRSHCMWVF